MRGNFSWGVAAILATAVGAAMSARADTVELVNGDVLNGQVVSLDAKQLQLVSDVHGKLTIAREKVAAIGLGERKLPAAKTAVSAEQAAPAVAAKPPAAGSVAEALKQLQSGGVGTGQLGELEQAFPLLKEPEAKKYFNKMVGGLMDGSVGVADVRKDAIRVREQLREATKELGPEAEQALSGYFTILDKFIRESEPEVKPERSEK